MTPEQIIDALAESLQMGYISGLGFGVLVLLLSSGGKDAL